MSSSAPEPDVVAPDPSGGLLASRLNPWRSVRGLPRALWLLCGAIVINRAGTMVLPFLAVYLTRERGFSPSQAGVVLACYGAGGLVAAPLGGRLSDRLGPWRVMRSALFAAGAIVLAFPLARRPWVIAAAAFLWSATAECFRPASMAVIADLVPQERRKAAFALSRLAINLGASIGPAAGGFLAGVSFLALFAVDATSSLVAGLVLMLGAPRSAHVSSPAPERPPAGDGSALRDRPFLIYLAALVPVCCVFLQMQGALALHLTRGLGMAEWQLGLLFSLNTVLVVAVEIPLNAATAAWSHRRSLVAGCLLTGGGFGAYAFTQGPVGAAAAVVIWTFGEMILLPASSAFVADRAPPDRRGRFMGLYQLAWGVSFTLGPWAGTVILERWGYRVLWGGALVAAGVSAALMVAATARRASSP